MEKIYSFILTMNNDLLHISLLQGKQFNTYQSKIKKNISKPLRAHNGSRFNREGFATQNAQNAQNRQNTQNTQNAQNKSNKEPKKVTLEQEASVVSESDGYNLVLKKQYSIKKFEKNLRFLFSNNSSNFSLIRNIFFFSTVFRSCSNNLH